MQNLAFAPQAAPAPSAGVQWVTADMIHFQQNKLLFGLFAKVGLNYNQAADKEVILSHVATVAGRGVTLSKLNLGQRLNLINHLAKAWEIKAVSIGVPNRLRAWRKGDPPASYKLKIIPAKAPHARWKRYILGLWLDLGYEPERIDARVARQFAVDRLEWLNEEADLQVLTKDLFTRCLKAGLDPEPF